MLSLHTNAAALSAQNSVGATQKNLSTSMSRLSAAASPPGDSGSAAYARESRSR